MVGQNFRFSIDRGGTFTDVYCEFHDSETGSVKQRVIKLLSEDPSNYKDAPTEGIRRILEQETGSLYPRGVPISTKRIEYIRMGTTVATNALLERNGERCALITTKGFSDLLFIGNQSRPKIFDLEIKRPDLLYEMVMEINERVLLVKDDVDQYPQNDMKLGLSHEKLYIEKRINIIETKQCLEVIKSKGIKSIAIVFLHGYTFPWHEREVRTIAQEMNWFDQISLSSDVMPTVRMVPRGWTTCVDAYLTPVIVKYLSSFRSGFDAELATDVQVSFMQSDGGLTPMDSFLGNRAILSGPAGGVVGYARTSYYPGANAVIGFDMGGTSTDVSRFEGTYEHVFESVTAGVTISSPQLDINTVAAGGGSRLYFRNGLFVVGPESAGSHPGPVCYRKGGVLAVTDANLVLGRLQPHVFPAIFGPNEDLPLDLSGSLAAFQSLTEEINAATVGIRAKPYTLDEVAYDFITVANEAMARPIRNLTTMKGHDVTDHSLACFGGAGPQHCCAIAQSLGMKKIYVHRYSGVLSAYGLSLADVVVEKQEPFSGSMTEEMLTVLKEDLKRLESSAKEQLLLQGFTIQSIRCLRYLALRYEGTDTSLMITLDEERDSDTAKIDIDSFTVILFKEAFITSYRREFGFELMDRQIIIDDIRIRAVGYRGSTVEHTFHESAKLSAPSTPPVPIQHISAFFRGGRRETPMYKMESLLPGHTITGPALIIQNVATVVIEVGCVCLVSASCDLEITVPGIEKEKAQRPVILDPLMLSLFSHRFMGIAEQMGRTLQRTSVSVNIKERLDFSCALFDGDGGLVANAPHLPVHLGVMSDAVKYQIRHWGTDLIDGDVLLSNHPQLAGGSHLPDITVMTPVFRDGKIVFFVASRGHHADVGGIAPGSMPPLSQTLAQEGAAIVACKIVKNGIFQEDMITRLLTESGVDTMTGLECVGTRALADNLSDLKAQVAANTRGVALMQELVNTYDLDVVCAYMKFIQSAAERAVRDMLKSFALQALQSEKPLNNNQKQNQNQNTNLVTVKAHDYLDEGTIISLAVTVNAEEGSAVFDFQGTGTEVLGNLNAPPAVTASAVIYSMRCLLSDMDIPLNQGCLVPIVIKIPSQCLLCPSSTAAVVGGNVLTSQRVTDVILKAFSACAASQGCMNNLTFGDETFGYYETIAGGAGAGKTWQGASGVHTHMTNTRITDPEIFEKRYPVLLRRFSLREKSGGKGRYRGGDGVIREIEFQKVLTVSILSERRAFQPYGLYGGENGARGLNLLYMKSSGRCVNIGGKNTVRVARGDCLTLYTPGGGGYGSEHEGDMSSSSLSPSSLQSQTVGAIPVLSSGSLLGYSMAQESA